MTMTAGTRAGTGTEALSYDAVSLSSLESANRAGMGATTLTLAGSDLANFDVTQKSRVGDTACEVHIYLTALQPKP